MLFTHATENKEESRYQQKLLDHSVLILRGGKLKCKLQISAGLFSSVFSPPTDCILFLAIKTLTDLAPPSLITWPAAARVFVPNVWNIFLWWEETIWVQCTNTKVQLVDLEDLFFKQTGQGRRFARILAMDSFHEFYFHRHLAKIYLAFICLPEIGGIFNFYHIIQQGRNDCQQFFPNSLIYLKYFQYTSERQLWLTNGNIWMQSL